ncbi:PH domain-containing protein [Faecalimonas sp.]
MDKKVYKSNVGLMYFLVSLIIAAILIGSFLYTRDNGNVIVTSIAFIVAAAIHYFVLIYPVIITKYVLETDRLVIHCGIYKNEIAFHDI